MKQFLTIIAVLLTLSACHHDDTPEETERVVMVYMANDNSGNWALDLRSDIRQMMEGSKHVSSANKLLAFVDMPSQKPFILEIAKGDTTRVYQYKESLNSSDATVMGSVLSKIVSDYPAKEYALVLWGHATGWEIYGDTRADNAGASAARTAGPRRGYGVEHGTNWMNIPDMARELSKLPKLKYIFADCCCFQSVEVDYELRQVTDYIIASAAEIPGEGAPYQTVVPALFGTADDFYKPIVDAYFEQVSWGYREPLSVVKTSEMEDLATATHDVLATFVPQGETSYPDVSGLIYYYYYDRTLDPNPAFFDMNDFILRHASDNDYQQWRRTFDKAVVYSTFVNEWMANHVSFYDFKATKERYGGVNMFVLQPDKTTFLSKLNKTISRMQWYSAARLSDFGW